PKSANLSKNLNSIFFESLDVTYEHKEKCSKRLLRHSSCFVLLNTQAQPPTSHLLTSYRRGGREEIGLIDAFFD
ncbi:MAG: hypothetical protein ACK5AY_00955, partial [Bacteroidota bacterium]